MPGERGDAAAPESTSDEPVNGVGEAASTWSLAAPRNGLLSLWCAHGSANIFAVAVRHDGSTPRL